MLLEYLGSLSTWSVEQAFLFHIAAAFSTMHRCQGKRIILLGDRFLVNYY